MEKNFHSMAEFAKDLNEAGRENPLKDVADEEIDLALEPFAQAELVSKQEAAAKKDAKALEEAKKKLETMFDEPEQDEVDALIPASKSNGDDMFAEPTDEEVAASIKPEDPLLKEPNDEEVAASIRRPMDALRAEPSDEEVNSYLTQSQRMTGTK
jgi:hypothetical protein